MNNKQQNHINTPSLYGSDGEGLSSLYGRTGVGIELLAPAKNLECGIAAIDHGADAVYIGAHSFGARHAAGNSVEDIRKLCQYAHQYGVKVYATVNTVIYDEEMDDAVNLVEELAPDKENKRDGVDAILVQDMGLLQHIKDLPPFKGGLERVHASTQTDNRSIEKVKWLRSLGFSRVVLARELSADEIRKIHEAVPDVELEVFVHGALCVSYSGQCYASEVCFGRSANRGACAQMCRMKYSLEDADGNKVADDAYYLSLKDQCQIDNLEDIIDAGACSLKIEGRLKDVAYVKNVVSAYSQRLNQIIAKSNGRYHRASWGKVDYSFTPDLKRSFNRGYTDYFLHGRHQNIASFYTSKAIGEYVGKVKNTYPTPPIKGERQNSFIPNQQHRHTPSMTGRTGCITVSGIASFVNGDGLCYINKNGNLKGFRVNRAEGNRLFPLQMPSDIVPGTSIYRSQDQAFDRLLAGKTATRLIHIHITLEDHGSELRLIVKGINAPISSVATLPLTERQQAQKPQLENMRRQLTKLGGTIYCCDNIDIDKSLDMLFIPSSQLADLRRRAIENIVVSNDDCEQTSRIAESGQQEHIECPHTYSRTGERLSYLYNAVNESSRTFYHSLGIDVGTERTGELLMQCRHCIRYSLGYCVKNGGKRPTWNGPLFLRLDDRRRFRLDFDCKNCQMNVYSDNP